MSNRRRLGIAALVSLASLSLAVSVFGPTRPTTHEAIAATLGVSRATHDLEAVIDLPGPVTVETVAGADWEVPRSGLINLDHEKAKAAKLVDGPEPIVVPFHAIRHPQHGLFLVDTGVEKALRDDPERSVMGGIIGKFMNVEKLHLRVDTASWIGAQPVAGVFLTHLHLDHVSGLRDVPNDATVFTGPRESTEKNLANRVIRSATDTALAGKGALNEWRFAPDPDGVFEGVVDVFGDGSVWALYVPGHTPGSTAYLARTAEGPILFTGDACHTAWGWQHGVEPGTYSDDRPKSAESLARLRGFVAKHQRIRVRLGHQSLPEGVLHVGGI